MVPGRPKKVWKNAENMLKRGSCQTIKEYAGIHAGCGIAETLLWEQISRKDLLTSLRNLKSQRAILAFSGV